VVQERRAKYSSGETETARRVGARFSIPEIPSAQGFFEPDDEEAGGGDECAAGALGAGAERVDSPWGGAACDGVIRAPSPPP
jgi:hypothetical protein